MLLLCSCCDCNAPCSGPFPVEQYGTFGCECCARESHFWHFNHLLRMAAQNEEPLGSNHSRPRPRVHLPGTASPLSVAGAAYLSSDTVITGELEAGPRLDEGLHHSVDPCFTIHVQDLQRMMLCNNSVGSCSGRSGWTIDGLHPTKAIYLHFFGISVNVAADLGGQCLSVPHPHRT